jgi:membrane-bound lytic murein transglycosylase D
MLKTRLSKAFYLCNSFLLLAIPFTGNHKPFIHTSAPSVSKAMETTIVRLPVEKHNDISTDDGYAFTEPQIKLNEKGVLFVRKYIRNRGDCLVNVKKRSVIPFDIIDSVFTLYKLPVELKYLAVVESELKPSAISQVGARGPWQLMPGTAKVLGLKITRQNDERTNFYKSTRAAARYLKDLHAQFNDWLLVLAAYNGGPKPVYRAIHKSGSKNFWVLQKYLPSESREHVKKFIATHYYFEGHGSEATLTQTEDVEYLKALNAFESKKAHLAAADDMQLKTETPVRPESSDEKFKRVMQESAECLKKSGKLI